MRLNRYRPFVRWWWFGGAVERSEIEHQLHEMKEVGIGGVEIQPVYPLSTGKPGEPKNLVWLSDEFLDMVSFAVETADRLGLTVDLTLGSGWPFGGPHIPKELAARKLRYDFWDLSEGETWTGADRPLDPDEQLLYLHALPVREGALAFSGGFDLCALGQAAVGWRALRGKWRVVRYASSYTRQMVKRATVGSEGWVADHFSRDAMQKHFREVGEKLARATKGRARCYFSDSWEVFGSNWTEGFLEEFKKRRGYDLLPYLPALDNEIPDVSPGIRYDYYLTLSDLLIENYILAMGRWSRSKGSYSRIQVHGGTPGDVIRGYGLAHVPECECGGWADSSAIGRTPKFASSAAHLYGRREVSCETFTHLRRPRFLVNPRMLKVAAERMYCHGVNHLIYHGYSYSPRSIGSPGWVFYASTMINHNNTWWPYVRHLNGRCSILGRELHRGDPTADVLIYTSLAEAWAKKTTQPKPATLQLLGRQLGSLPEILWHSGYDFDLANDDVVSRSSVMGGRIQVSGLRYALLLVPRVDYIPLKTMEKLMSLVRTGGKVLFVGKIPHDSPFPPGDDRTRGEMIQMRDEMDSIRLASPDDCSPGLAKSEEDVTQFLRRLAEPDVLLTVPDPETAFIHRHLADREIYFLCSAGEREKTTEASFRVDGLVPHLVDLETGREEQACVYARRGKRTVVSLTFAPYGSHLLVFRKARQVAHLTRSDLSNISRSRDGGMVARVSSAGTYDLTDWKSRRSQLRIQAIPRPLEVSGWTLSVHGHLEPRRLERLCSWTDIPELRGFSGQGIYEAEFELPESCTAEGIGLEIDLGDVYEAATVQVNNGRPIDLWMPPYAAEITEYVKEGTNTLRATACNILINRVLDLDDPDYSDLEKAYGLRFPLPSEKRECRPQLSGILGPVVIRPFAVTRIGEPRGGPARQTFEGPAGP